MIFSELFFLLECEVCVIQYVALPQLMQFEKVNIALQESCNTDLIYKNFANAVWHISVFSTYCIWSWWGRSSSQSSAPEPCGAQTDLGSTPAWCRFFCRSRPPGLLCGRFPQWPGSFYPCTWNKNTRETKNTVLWRLVAAVVTAVEKSQKEMLKFFFVFFFSFSFSVLTSLHLSTKTFLAQKTNFSS